MKVPKPPNNLESPANLELLKFHWDKWQSESKSFWRRASVSSVLLVLLILHQFGTVNWKLEWFDYRASPEHAVLLNRLLFNPLSWCLLVYVFFGFVDLLRHRVPESMESVVHNNTINIGPFSRTQNLKSLGRWLYLIGFSLYFSLLAAWLVATTRHVWK